MMIDYRKATASLADKSYRLFRDDATKSVKYHRKALGKAIQRHREASLALKRAAFHLRKK